MTGKISTEIGTFTDLLALSLEENDFSGTLPSETAELTELTELFIDSNKF